MAEFDYIGAKKAGATDEQISQFLISKGIFKEVDLDGAKKAGATDEQISTFINEAISKTPKNNNTNTPIKKKEDSKSESTATTSTSSGTSLSGTSKSSSTQSNTSNTFPEYAIQPFSYPTTQQLLKKSAGYPITDNKTSGEKKIDFTKDVIQKTDKIKQEVKQQKVKINDAKQVSKKTGTINTVKIDVPKGYGLLSKSPFEFSKDGLSTDDYAYIDDKSAIDLWKSTGDFNKIPITEKDKYIDANIAAPINDEKWENGIREQKILKQLNTIRILKQPMPLGEKIKQLPDDNSYATDLKNSPLHKIDYLSVLSDNDLINSNPTELESLYEKTGMLSDVKSQLGKEKGADVKNKFDRDFKTTSITISELATRTSDKFNKLSVKYNISPDTETLPQGIENDDEYIKYSEMQKKLDALKEKSNNLIYDKAYKALFDRNQQTEASQITADIYNKSGGNDIGKYVVSKTFDLGLGILDIMLGGTRYVANGLGVEDNKVNMLDRWADSFDRLKESKERYFPIPSNLKRRVIEDLYNINLNGKDYKVLVDSHGEVIGVKDGGNYDVHSDVIKSDVIDKFDDLKASGKLPDKKKDFSISGAVNTTIDGINYMLPIIASSVLTEGGTLMPYFAEGAIFAAQSYNSAYQQAKELGADNNTAHNFAGKVSSLNAGVVTMLPVNSAVGAIGSGGGLLFKSLFSDAGRKIATNEAVSSYLTGKIPFSKLVMPYIKEWSGHVIGGTVTMGAVLPLVERLAENTTNAEVGEDIFNTSKPIIDKNQLISDLTMNIGLSILGHSGISNKISNDYTIKSYQEIFTNPNGFYEGLQNRIRQGIIDKKEGEVIANKYSIISDKIDALKEDIPKDKIGNLAYLIEQKDALESRKTTLQDKTLTEGIDKKLKLVNNEISNIINGKEANPVVSVDINENDINNVKNNIETSTSTTKFGSSTAAQGSNTMTKDMVDVANKINQHGINSLNSNERDLYEARKQEIDDIIAGKTTIIDNRNKPNENEQTGYQITPNESANTGQGQNNSTAVQQLHEDNSGVQQGNKQGVKGKEVGNGSEELQTKVAISNKNAKGEPLTGEEQDFYNNYKEEIDGLAKSVDNNGNIANTDNLKQDGKIQKAKGQENVLNTEENKVQSETVAPINEKEVQNEQIQITPTESVEQGQQNDVGTGLSETSKNDNGLGAGNEKTMSDQEKVSVEEQKVENPALKDVESTAKALEKISKINPTVWEQIKQLVGKAIDTIKGIGKSEYEKRRKLVDDIEFNDYPSDKEGEIILKKDGKNIGSMDLHYGADGLLHIKWVKVNKDFQGKGLSLLLYGKAVEVAKQKGLKGVGTGFVTHSTSKTQGIYKHFNLTELGESKGSMEEGVKGRKVILHSLKEDVSESNTASEAYHKAKADGSNPELVKAVEDLLGGKEEVKTEKKVEKPAEQKQEQQTEQKQETKPDQKPTIEQQVKTFGVADKLVKPVTEVANALFSGLKKVGLVAKESVEDWLHIGKADKVDENSLDGFIESVKKELPKVEKKESKIQSWIDKWNELKKQKDLKELDLFYNKVKVALNGYAQGKGVETEFKELKKDIEDYAEKLKQEQEPKVSTSTEFDTNKQPINKLEDLQDVGEKIGGAKKDLAQALSEVTEDDIKGKPLSKVFPRPDFKKLVEEGSLSQDAAILLNFIYDNIPAKPRKSYRLASWTKTVQGALETTQQILEAESAKNTDFVDKIRKAVTLSETLKRDYEIYSETLKGLGFPNEQVNLGRYKIRKFASGTQTKLNKETGKLEPVLKDVYTIVNDSFIIKDFNSMEEAINGLKAILNNKGTKPEGTKFDIYQDRKTKEFFIGKKGAIDVVRVMQGFKTLGEARNFLKEKQADIQGLWDAMKAPKERRMANRPRVGADWRKGKNVDSKEFADTFGFRGVEFGNWVNNAERQSHVNEAYDALMDLASVLGISPKALSLNGELGFAFGARGSGKANAHYEAGKVVINLTKTRGAGSLAHEWWHAMDNYFSRNRGQKESFITQSPRDRIERDGSRNQGVRKEMIDAFKSVMDAIEGTKLSERSKVLDRTRSEAYWSTPIEMSARAFENYIIEKLGERNQQNDYLANFKETADWISDTKGNIDALKNYPYPLAEETPIINEKFQQFFETIKEGENAKLFKDAEAQYRIESGKNIIEAIKDFDGSPKAVTAIVHEFMHPTVVEIFNGAKDGNETGSRHSNTIVEEYNKANPDKKITLEQMIEGNDAFVNGRTTPEYRAVQEFIAEAWEKYHHEGAKGFSKAFQEVLDAITEVFRQVYKSLTGTTLTPELRKMFDELLGKENVSEVVKAVEDLLTNKTEQNASTQTKEQQQGSDVQSNIAESKGTIQSESEQIQAEKDVKAEEKVTEVKEPTSYEQAKQRAKELKGKDLVADALERIASKAGAKKNLTEEERTSLKQDFVDLGIGLIQMGKASINNVIDKIKETLNEYYPELDDKEVESLSKEVLSEIGNRKNEIGNVGLGISKQRVFDKFGKSFEKTKIGWNEIAKRTLADLSDSADSKKSTVEKEAETQVNNIYKEVTSGKPIEVSDHKIVTTATHIIDLEQKLDDLALEKTEDIARLSDRAIEIEKLQEQREKALFVLDKLGSQSGRNLGIFAGIFSKTDDGGISASRAVIEGKLGFKLPENEADLKDSDLTPKEKEIAIQYIKELNDLKKKIEDDKKLFEEKQELITEEEVRARIKEAYNKGKNDASNGNETKRQTEKRKVQADEFRKLKRKPLVLKDENGNDIIIIQNSIFNINDLIELGAQAIEVFGKTEDAVADAIKKLKEQDWYKNLSDINKKITEEYLNADIQSQIQKVKLSQSRLRELVKAGIESNSDYNIDNLIEDLINENPDLVGKERAVRDAISGYGVTKESSQLPEDVALRKIKRVASYISALEDIENGIRPKKTGFQRDKIKDDERVYLQKIKAGLSKLPLSNEDSANKLKTAQEIIEQRLKNQIESLDNQIKSGERPEKGKPVETTERIEKLKEQRDALLEQRRKIDLLSKKANALSNIENIAKNENSTTLTKSMVENGLISDLIDDVISKGAKEENVVSDIYDMLKNILPDITRKQLNNAIISKGEFQKETVKKVKTELEQKIQKVKQISNLESRLDALQNADNYNSETDIKKKEQIKSDYEKLLESNIAELKKQQGLQKQIEDLQNGIEKEKKTKGEESESVKALQKQLAELKKQSNEKKSAKEIEEEIQRIKSGGEIFKKAIKDKRQTGEDLVNTRKKLKELYVERGIKRETGSSESTTAKQLVIDNLSDAINNNIDNLTQRANQKILDGEDATSINKAIKVLSDINYELKTNSGLDLKEKINKAYESLDNFKSDNKQLNEEVAKIKKEFQEDWQKTADELSKKRIVKQYENEINTANRKMNGSHLTEIPTEKYDVKRDSDLAAYNLERKRIKGRLGQLVQRANEKNKTISEKIVNWRRSFLTGGLYTMARVGISGITKPFFDPLIMQTAGRISSLFPGLGETKTPFSATIEGYKNLFRFRSEKSAEEYISKKEQQYNDAITKYESAKGTSGEKEAYGKLLEAEYNHAQAQIYKFISTNIAVDAKDLMLYDSTKFDKYAGKGMYLQWKDIQGKDEKILYIINALNRTHAVLKNPSARRSFAESYTRNILNFQKQGIPLDAVARMRAMDMAILQYEEGKFGQDNAVVTALTKIKQTSPAVKNIMSWLIPVARVSTNIVKSGVDMSTLGTEGFVRYFIGAKDGMKINKQEGLQFKNGLEAFRKGVEKLPKKDKEYIAKVMARGMFGAALMVASLAMYNAGYIMYGGEYDEKRRKKRKGMNGNELEHGQWEIMGHTLGKFGSGVLNHLPEFLPIAMAVNTAYVYEEEKTDNNTNFESALETMKSDVNEIYERLPIPNTTIDNIFSLPPVPLIKDWQKYYDVDEHGETIKRKPSTLLEHIQMETGIGQRKVPEKGSTKSTTTKQQSSLTSPISRSNRGKQSTHRPNNNPRNRNKRHY